MPSKTRFTFPPDVVVTIALVRKQCLLKRQLAATGARFPGTFEVTNNVAALRSCTQPLPDFELGLFSLENKGVKLREFRVQG